MIEIIPAILPKNSADLEEGLLRLQGVAPFVQIDLVGTNVLETLEAMPLWQEFNFEFDIMLPDPLHEIERCIDMGASRIVVHARAMTAREAMEQLQHLRGGEYPVAVGIALGAHDSPQTLAPFVGLYDYVQVMGIDHIGAQGQPPDPHGKHIELLHTLRELYPSLPLQVDGAAAANPRALVEAGATSLVIGSAILRAEDPYTAYKQIYTEVNGAHTKDGTDA